MKGLKLTLYAPLQYYHKETTAAYGTMQTNYISESHPTKSAICGLIGCAMGYKRNDERLQTLSSQFDMYWRTERGNREIITDFQTIRPLSDEDKFAKVGGGFTSNGLIKYVEYISDTEFSVYLSGEDVFLRAVHYAIEHPTWSVYFGRKSCQPAKPIVTKQFIMEDIPNDAVKCV